MVAPLSESQLNQRNGDAVNAVVGANQSGAPASAAESTKASPMSWYSGNHEQPTSVAASVPTR
ncbi:Uncharacterised protein [Mycobacterium tuberculosis]|uniref:Uncharacterized protein n=1 Tax=Mycobacterium tuberculosis TaxID=1773 RepID=A0A655FYM3_MYCTX|nr:Uncharacterised protein [Mycobacterium tuberculosis]CNT96350.1 Uncharacterised protein [Mycobacterium tuberculosis]CNV14240.1 Uncharacterised protein [Mycobacterium tuberculosis]CNX26149.1 Uncharacterised protein [Mycobacterium tuberculosis]COY25390.1 Uncharacterised protein [Mycobacterium tuberculosis]